MQSQSFHDVASFNEKTNLHQSSRFHRRDHEPFDFDSFDSGSTNKEEKLETERRSRVIKTSNEVGHLRGKVTRDRLVLRELRTELVQPHNNLYERQVRFWRHL